MTGETAGQISRIRAGIHVGVFSAVVCAAIRIFMIKSSLGASLDGNPPIAAILYPWELFGHYIFQVGSYFALFFIVPVVFLCFHFCLGFGIGYLSKSLPVSALFIGGLAAVYFSVSGYKLSSYPQKFKTVHIGDSKDSVIEKMGQPEQYGSVLLSGEKSVMLYGRSVPPMWWTVALDGTDRVVGVGFTNMKR